MKQLLAAAEQMLSERKSLGAVTFLGFVQHPQLCACRGVFWGGAQPLPAPSGSVRRGELRGALAPPLVFWQCPVPTSRTGLWHADLPAPRGQGLFLNVI